VDGAVVGGSWLLLLSASPAVLSMCSCTVKLGEEKSKSVGLAQEIGFGGSARFAAVAGERPQHHHRCVLTEKI